MATVPQSRRCPRARLEEHTPTVLRFPNGERIEANLRVVSLTGGLLALPEPVHQGSQVKLMFLTGAGSVLGGAEMLPPVDGGLQPFRFVSLGADDHRRLGALIARRPSPDESDLAWIEKLRAASAQRAQPRWRLKTAGMVGLLMIGLATVAYVLHFEVLK